MHINTDPNFNKNNALVVNNQFQPFINLNQTQNKKKKHMQKMPTLVNLNINHQKKINPLETVVIPKQMINMNQINKNVIKINPNIQNNPNNCFTNIQGMKMFGPIKPLGQTLIEANNNNREIYLIKDNAKINININDLSKFVLIRKKYNFNIVYYDENLNKYKDNIFLCSYLMDKLEGAFYGIDNFNLFKYICYKIGQNNKYFILISSGSTAKKLYDYCNEKNINKICVYFIYTSNFQKYLYLQNLYYPKLNGIFSNFKDLINKIFSSNNDMIIKNIPIKLTNLIFLEDYNNTYIKFHLELIRKYALYKLMHNTNKITKFSQLVKKKELFYKNLSRELLFNEEDMIKYFKIQTREPEEKLRKMFNGKHDVYNYISNYTLESFYYKYINKFLREGDFNSFRIISSHIAKFIYHLYNYRKTHPQTGSNTLYRSMYITQGEYLTYLNSIGRVICYPSFTSTSLKPNYIPIKINPNSILVKLVIQQNNSNSIINIRDISRHPGEEEFLCLPFSFFQITNVVCKTVGGVHSDIIYLTALRTEKPLEEMFLGFMENETDNLDFEGLQMLRLSSDGNALELNIKVKAQFYKNYMFIF